MISMIFLMSFAEYMINEFFAAQIKYFQIGLISIKDMIEIVYFIFQAGFYFNLFIVKVLDLIQLIIVFYVWFKFDVYLGKYMNTLSLSSL